MGLQLAAILPFVALTSLRLYLFDPWNVFKNDIETPDKEIKIEEMPMNLSQLGVDPFNPSNRSYMDQNLKEAQKKLLHGNDN